MTCEGCGSDESQFVADLGVPHGRRGDGLGLAPVRLSLCADCHPYFNSPPPWDDDPGYCGRETDDGSPCLNGSRNRKRRKWQACHLHKDTSWPNIEGDR